MTQTLPPSPPPPPPPPPPRGREVRPPLAGRRPVLPPPPPPPDPEATADPFRELTLVAAAQPFLPRPIPRPGGTPGWPPEPPALGANWVDGPAPRRRAAQGRRIGLVLAALTGAALVLAAALAALT